MMTCPQPPGTPHDITHSAGNEHHQISIATAKSVLLSAAIDCYLPRLCLSPHISHSLMRFAQIPRVYSPMSSMLLTSWQFLQARMHISYIERASVPRRQPTVWWEKLPLGAAVGPPGAARLKTCVRALTICTSSARLGGGPSSTTNERRLSKKNK